MPASPIRRLMPSAVAAVQRGIKIYHLNIGQPDLATPASILSEVQHFHQKTIAYAPSQGILEVIRAWQTYYASHGLHLTDNEVLVTAGGSEAIIFAMMSVADPGDEIIVFDPTYTNYSGFAAAAGVRLVPVVLNQENGYRVPPGEEIEAVITPRTRAILICNPNNPTGSVYTLAELQLILDLAERHNLFVISDEAYREFVFDGRVHHNFLQLPGAEQRVIMVDSLSKRFNVCGARAGCLVSHNVQVMGAALRFAQARLSVATVEQLAMVPLLNDASAYTATVAAEYQRRRDAVVAALARIPGVTFRCPEGAFYLIVGLPIPDSDDFARWLLEEFAVNGETVMVAPLGGFYVTPGLGGNAIRIAFVLEERALTRAIELLGIALEQYNASVVSTAGSVSLPVGS